MLFWRLAAGLSSSLEEDCWRSESNLVMLGSLGVDGLDPTAALFALAVARCC
jgi:hypothetical protein